MEYNVIDTLHVCALKLVFLIFFSIILSIIIKWVTAERWVHYSRFVWSSLVIKRNKIKEIIKRSLNAITKQWKR